MFLSIILDKAPSTEKNIWENEEQHQNEFCVVIQSGLAVSLTCVIKGKEYKLIG